MTLANERYVEELYYKAVDLMESENYAEAKEVLVDALTEDPTYALVHNQLGWIYTYKLFNLKRAGEHYELALKYGEGFAAPYMNYAAYLLEINDFDKLRAFVSRSIHVPGIDKGYLLALKAITYEVKTEYELAVKTINEAKQYTLNTEYIDKLNTDKDRVYAKMGKWRRMKSLLF